jgi:hypothetical protein
MIRRIGWLSQRTIGQESGGHGQRADPLSHFHPPSAIVNPTIALPTITINMPILQGGRPE